MNFMEILISKEVVAMLIQAVVIFAASIIYPYIQERRKHSLEIIRSNISNKEVAFSKFTKVISTTMMLQRTYKHYLSLYKRASIGNAEIAIADKEAYRPILRDLHLNFIQMDLTYDAVCSIAKLEFETLSRSISTIEKNINLYIESDCTYTDENNEMCLNPSLIVLYKTIVQDYDEIVSQMHKIIVDTRCDRHNPRHVSADSPTCQQPCNVSSQ